VPIVRRPAPGIGDPLASRHEPSLEDTGGLVRRPERHERRVEKNGGRFGDVLEHPIRVERRGDDLVHRGERCQAGGADLLLPVEPRVLEGDRRLRRADLHHLDVVGRDRTGLVPVDDEGAEDAAARHERRRQHRAVAFALHGRPRRRRQLDAGIVQKVAGPHRSPLEDGAGRRPVPPVTCRRRASSARRRSIGWAS
jgi:hypothetical protein